MNQPLLVIGLIELAAVLLVGCSVLMGIKWRNKRRRQAGIEALLDDIKDRQTPRVDRLARALVGKFGVDESAAKPMVDSLIAAEKQFLQLFVKQQMQQQPIDSFYENLCVLLDGYLDNMPGPVAKPVAAKPAENAPSADPAPAQDAALTETPAIEEEAPPPDWGDVFD